jgi:hypothetical protein
VEMALGAFERKMLRKIYGPMQKNVHWIFQYNGKISGLCKDIEMW